ncbi:MAG: hypothetical protein RSA20_03405 [Oscillospiraceae bacterium]
MKKVDFLFIYEVRSREIENLALLAACLEKRHYTVAFLNSWQCLGLKYPSYEAEVVVISACYDTGTYQYFTGHAAKFKKVVNLQWEQVLKNGFLQSEEPVSWDFSGEGLVTRHVCWGEKERERLENRYGIKEEFLRVCGYLPLDFYRPEFSDFIIKREPLFKESGLDPHKVTALFISSFAMVGLPKEHTGVCNEALKREIIENSYDSQREILEWFRQALKKYPMVQFIYRFHPTEADNPILGEMAREYPNFFCISTHAIKHWICACDKIYNWVSTSAAEVYKSGKQAFILRPIPVSYGCDMPIFEGCSAITDLEGFEKSVELEGEKTSQPLAENALKGYYEVGETPSYIKVCDFLCDSHNSCEYHSRQYEKNTQFTRFSSRMYTRFWTSRLNISLVKLAKRTRLNIGFLNCRREAELPTRQKDLQEESYRKSRCRVNVASDKEIRELIDRYKTKI